MSGVRTGVIGQAAWEYSRVCAGAGECMLTDNKTSGLIGDPGEGNVVYATAIVSRT